MSELRGLTSADQMGEVILREYLEQQPEIQRLVKMRTDAIKRVHKEWSEENGIKP